MEHFSDIPHEESEIPHIRQPLDTGESFGGLTHETLITPGTSDATTHRPEFLAPDTDRPGFVPFTETRPLEPYEQAAADKRERVMHKIEDFNIPLDVPTDASINHYAAALGLGQASETVTVDSDEALETINQAVKEVTERNPNVQAHTGIYLDELGIAVVNLKITKPEDSTKVHVHERVGHGSSGVVRLPFSLKRLWYTTFYPESPNATRGFVSGSGGAVVEESFARIVDVEYQRSTGSRVQPQEGAWEGVPIGSRHAYNERLGVYELGAQAFLALCEASPDLMEVALASRRDPEARAAFSAMVNDVSPGLYARIMEVRALTTDPEKGFNEELDRVLHATGLTHDDLPDICDRGRAVSYISGKLAAYEQTTGYRFKK